MTPGEMVAPQLSLEEEHRWLDQRRSPGESGENVLGKNVTAHIYNIAN